MVRVHLLIVTMSLLFLLPVRAAAQGPVITRFVAAVPAGAVTDTRPVLMPADSARPARETWWLEAGIGGAVIMGALFSSVAGMGDVAVAPGERAAAFLMGAMIGFVPAALIGGQIEKR